MAKRCNRDDCGHEEETHLPPSQGGCFAKNTHGHMCLCSAFVSAEVTDGKPPSVPPLRVVEPFDHRAVGAGGGDEGDELKPVRDRGEALARAAACHRTTDPKGTGPLLQVLGEPIRTRSERHTIIDPGAKIMVAGKPREMTELHAAANAIVAATNCDDLAVGAARMRDTIRTQSYELNRLRAELEVRGKAVAPVVNLTVRVDVNGKEAKPGDLVEGIRKALQQFANPTINIS